MDAPSWISLAVFAALNLAAASSGALFKPGEWYASLNRPAWTPPNLAFPLVWSVLYALNTAAGWLVWREAGFEAAPAMGLYVVAMVLNAAWSWLFFGRRRMDQAMGDVILLWLSLAGVIALFAQIRPLAALLVAPYLLWVTIAAALNRRMIQLNPAAARGG